VSDGENEGEHDRALDEDELFPQPIEEDEDEEDDGRDDEGEAEERVELLVPERELEDIGPNEDDIDDMFELARAVADRVRENNQQRAVNEILNPPPPLPPLDLPPLLPPQRDLPIPQQARPPRPPAPPRVAENIDVEIQVNFEIIGLRGPLFGALTYCCLLIGFNTMFIIVGLFLPSRLALVFFFMLKYNWTVTASLSPLFLSLSEFFPLSFSFFSSSLQWLETSPLLSLTQHSLQHLLTSSTQFLSPLLQPTTSNQLFSLQTIFTVTVGYLIIASYFYLAHFIQQIILSFFLTTSTRTTLSPTLQYFFKYTPRILDVFKIATFMLIRIFWLPCVIGMTILACFNLLIQTPTDTLVIWCGDHLIGALVMCWGVGIAYMLTTTISILQLREILHPDWLSKFIRPQESQVDLLTSLLLDPFLVQLRRLFLSFLVYGALIFLFLFVPIYLLKNGLGGNFFQKPFSVYFWYFSPNLQIFLEVGFLHTSFLMVLERKKDVIGYWQHRLLRYLTHQLGVSRYVLPYAMKIVTVSGESER
jgi:hypothetical protein